MARKYRMGGREKLLAIGAYGDITLKQARDAREEARRLIAIGIDPAEQRKHQKEISSNTFETVAQECLSTLEHKLSKVTLAKARWQLREFFTHTW